MIVIILYFKFYNAADYITLPRADFNVVQTIVQGIVLNNLIIILSYSAGTTKKLACYSCYLRLRIKIR